MPWSPGLLSCVVLEVTLLIAAAGAVPLAAMSAERAELGGSHRQPPPLPRPPLPVRPSELRPAGMPPRLRPRLPPKQPGGLW